MNIATLILFLTFISTISAIILGFKAFPEETMRNLYVNKVYYFLIINLLLWFFALIKTKQKGWYETIFDYWKKHKWGVIVALLLTVCGIFASIPDYRVLADETNLLSLSRALYEERECKNYTSVKNYYYGFKDIISWEVDKRPALFPLTVSFFHSLFGYRPENAFAVNIIAGFLSLLLMYHLVSVRFGRFFGICSMVLLASYPLFLLFYTSAGFEIFNLMFSLILFWLLSKFIKEPNALNAEALVYVLPLISQTRYESSSAFICVLPAIFMILPKKEYFKFSFKLCILPLLFIPVAWLRLLTDNARGLQVDEVGKAAFAWEHFVTNSKKAVSFFLGSDLSCGMVSIIAFMAISGLILFLLDYIVTPSKRLNLESIKFDIFKIDLSKIKRKYNYKLAIFGSSLFLFYLLHAVIRFAYYWGDLTYKFNTRLGIIFLPIFVLGSVYLFYWLWMHFNVKKSYFLLISMMCLLIYWPVAGQNYGIRELTLYREFRAVREFLQQHFPNKNEYILVADRANLYIPFKYNCVSFTYLKNNVSTLKSNLNNRTYNYIVFLQTINRETGEPTNRCIVPSAFKLTNLHETQIKVDQYLRISKYDLSSDSQK